MGADNTFGETNFNPNMSMRDNTPEGIRNRNKLTKEAYENWKNENTESAPFLTENGKVLPCPFCGTQPEWINEVVPDRSFLTVITISDAQLAGFVMKADRRDKVIGFWNQRVANAAAEKASARIAELENEIQFQRACVARYKKSESELQQKVNELEQRLADVEKERDEFAIEFIKSLDMYSNDGVEWLKKQLEQFKKQRQPQKPQ